jgi:hypothetical protein
VPAVVAARRGQHPFKAGCSVAASRQAFQYLTTAVQQHFICGLRKDLLKSAGTNSKNASPPRKAAKASSPDRRGAATLLRHTQDRAKNDLSKSS